MFTILALNPGSTSTKMALYRDDHCLFTHSLEHRMEELQGFPAIVDQEEYRREAVLATLQDKGYSLKHLSALVVRGGLLKPLKGGVYAVNEKMVEDLKNSRYGEHASNLGALMGLPLAQELGIPVFTVDPVTVDEFTESARYSGLKGIHRLSMPHALNMKAMARRAAADMGKSYADINLVVAHLGSGTSVSAHRRGRMIDVNNANNEGPFSLERCGTLPAVALIQLCFSGRYNLREMVSLVTAKGGIFSYLGSKDFREVEKKAMAGDVATQRVVEAMVYQIAKEIGAMAAVLDGDVQRIVLTGGMAHAQLVTEPLTQKISFIAPVVVIAGEEELQALVLGALRALRGEENPLQYV